MEIKQQNKWIHSPFKDLAPQDNVELGIYKDALDFALSNRKIRNIAISGSYGVGKSSVLDSYKRVHHERSFTHISMAHFTESLIDDSLKEEAEKSTNEEMVSKYKPDWDRVLEGKILNQLIHQIDLDLIPESEIKVKRVLTKKAKWIYAIVAFLMLMFFVLAGMFFLHNLWGITVDKLSQSILKDILLYTTTKEAFLLIGTILLILLWLGIYNLLKVQQKKHIFKKVSFQGNDVELFGNDKDDYFDRFLSEALYLFEHSTAENIVFEDIDRFENNQIFEKLREINTLLNSRITQGISEKKTPIRFIYLLRDDLFSAKDRTKFFDFIIPIVPVVGASNSYEKFDELFKEFGINELFDIPFIQEISLYIDDMRIIKNIVNEFLVYYGRLKTNYTKKSGNKLLAMIIYKNTFPSDFSQLRLSRGYVYALFNCKAEFIKEEQEGLDTEIRGLTKKHEEFKSQLCRNIDELDALFINFDDVFQIDGEKEKDFENRVDFIRAIKENDYNVQNSSDEECCIKDSFSDLMKLEVYKERKDIVEGNFKQDNLICEEKIYKLKKKKDSLAHAYLKDIITRENMGQIFEDEKKIKEDKDVKQHQYFPLIKYLISYGFIDETYYDFMTYFEEGSINKNDKEFLLSITDKDQKGYEFSLSNPKEIISRMRETDFGNLESLNFDLLNYLLDNKHDYHMQLRKYLGGIREDSHSDFVSAFLAEERNNQVDFVVELNRLWGDACFWILVTGDFNNITKDSYVLLSLYNSKWEHLETNNMKKCITKYINGNSRFLTIREPKTDRLIKMLTSLEVKFTTIDYDMSNKDLFESVYVNNLYSISVRTIALLLEKVYHIPSKDIQVGRSLSLILSRPNEPLCKYVLANLERYLTDMITFDCEIEDSQEVIRLVLNHKNVSDKTKLDYISLLSVEVDTLRSIDNRDLWVGLLDRKLITINEANIKDYYFLSGFGFDDNLVDFINLASKPIQFSWGDIDELYGENACEGLLNDLLCANDIEGRHYKNLIRSAGVQREEFSTTGINEEKIEILIQLGIVKMSSANLEFMRENYPLSVMNYIAKSPRVYISIMCEELFSHEELLDVLDSRISNKIKIELLGFEEEALTVLGKGYSDEVINYILDNNLLDTDILHLIKHFSNKNEMVKNTILRITLENIDEIVEEEYGMDNELLILILDEENVSKENKKYLIANNLNTISKETVERRLTALGERQFIRVMEGKNPLIAQSGGNKALLTVMEKRKWISSFKLDTKNPNYYRVFGFRK